MGFQASFEISLMKKRKTEKEREREIRSNLVRY